MRNSRDLQVRSFASIFVRATVAWGFVAFASSGAIAEPTPATPVTTPVATKIETPDGTPNTTTTAVPSPAPTQNDGKEALEKKMGACKKLVAKLTSPSFKPAQGISNDEQKVLAEIAPAPEALTCLANATDNDAYCSILQSPGKGYCTNLLEVGRDLKKAPKTAIKAYYIYSYCRQAGIPKADCDRGLAVMTKGNPAGCKEFTSDFRRNVCKGILTGDTKVCDQMKSSDDRIGCLVLATGNASACPKDSKPCAALAESISAATKDGVEGLKSIEPALAATKLGRDACSDLIKKMGESCQSPASNDSAPDTNKPKAEDPKSAGTPPKK